MGVIFLAILIALPLRYLSNKKTEYSDAKWRVGYSRQSILPADFESKDYVIAGYFTEETKFAESVLDGIFVRAVCMNDGSGKGTYAIAVIDSFGLPLDEVKAIRNSLADFRSIYNIYAIDILTTHTHHSIDTQGFGSDLITGENGVDTQYLKMVKDKTSLAIRTAYSNMQEGALFYGETSIAEYLKDEREPEVVNDTLAKLRFKPTDEKGKELYIVNGNFELNNLGADSLAISGDVPFYIEQTLNENNIDMLFVNGSFGGDCLLDLSSLEKETNEEAVSACGKEFASSLMGIDNEVALEEKLVHKRTTVSVPVTNELMEYLFNNDIILNKPTIVNMDTYKYSYTTEVGYLGIGGIIHIALISGEVFPELIFGGLREADESVSGNNSVITPLIQLIPEAGTLLCFGMANDSIGHIIPDNDYNADISLGTTVEETTSLGMETAERIMGTLKVLIETTLQN